MASAITRAASSHSILGKPRELRKNQLPTSADVFRAYDHYLKTEKAGTSHERVTRVALEVKELYDRASIPTANVGSIATRIKRLVAKVQELGKYSNTKKSSVKYEWNLQSLENLFDICACKCFDSGVRERLACTCPLHVKFQKLNGISGLIRRQLEICL